MTPDIIANAIVAALSAGAVAGAKDTTKTAIADAYEGLKSLIKKDLDMIAKPLRRSKRWKPSPILMAGKRPWPKNWKRSTPPLILNWSLLRSPCSR
jgi:hypothetical protein